MTPLKVGDRVAVYSGERHVGIIMRIDKGIGFAGPIEFSCANPNMTIFVHPKQCRLLKKKTPPREFELKHIKCSDGVWRTIANYPIGDNEAVRVREVIDIKKKK